jgi:hypothetical protein
MNQTQLKQDISYIINKVNSIFISLVNLTQKLDTYYEANSPKANSPKVTPSQIAKGGYREEMLVATEINNTYKSGISKFLTTPIYADFIQKLGHTKTDISNGVTNIQVKKYKTGQFGQIDRHWINHLIDKIPDLKSIEDTLRGLCECVVVKDKCSKIRVKINSDNYTTNHVQNFIETLTRNKENIIRYALCGYDTMTEPHLLCGVEYVKNVRKKITFYRMADVIHHLLEQSFTIRPSGTVVALGPVFTFQRKGGDCGKPSGNQIQFKLVFSQLRISNKLEYCM